MNSAPLNIEHFSAGHGPGILCLREPLIKENIYSFQNAVRREESADNVILDFSDLP